MDNKNINTTKSQKRANDNLLKLMRLTNEMLALADEGDMDRQDDSCAILYGLMRDMAYSLRKHAEEERDLHINKGLWPE